ncbi:MAG: beta-galactosidase [Capsulimonadaceae bacterium]|nr:beta-galactosidase [Capsulimonadaceae bacterium]
MLSRIAIMALAIASTLASGQQSASSAEPPAQVSILRATIVKPGSVACSMWTLKTFDAPVTIPAHAALTYEVFVPQESIGLNGGVELDGGTLGNLRDTRGAVDQVGEGVRGGSVQAAHAGAWYTRRFDLSRFEGRTFSRIQFFSSEILSNLAGSYEARLRNVHIDDASGKPLAVYEPEPSVAPSAVLRNMVVNQSPSAFVPSASVPAPAAGAILSRDARLILERPWGANGVTPSPRAMPDDLREITISAPVTAKGVRVYIAAPYLRFSAPQIIPAGAILEYDMRIDPDSVSNAGGFDLESVPRTWLTLRDAPRITDQYGASPHPAYQARGALGQWLQRRFSLASIAERPFGLALLSAEFTPDRTGIYRASYRNIRIVNDKGEVYWSFYPELGALGECVPVLGNEGTFTAPGVVGVSLTPDRYVIAAGSRGKLDVSIHNYDPGVAQNATVSSVRLEGGRAPIILSKRLDVNLKPGETKTFSFDMDSAIAPGNYLPVADVAMAGRTAVSHGFAIAIVKGAAALPGPDEYLGKGHFAWGADMDDSLSPESFAELRQNGGNFVNLFVSWDHIETAPGKYDFTELDAGLARVAKAHMRAEVFFWTTDQEFPEWVRAEAMQDQDGKVGRRLSLSYYAPTGRPAYMKLIQATVDHYKTNDTVVGYQFAALGWGDGFFATPEHGTSAPFGLYDYSPWSQAAFRGYVRDAMRLSLDQAAQRYGVPLASWNDLTEPVCGSGIDLRPIWWDFQNFRCWTVENMLDEICRTVRASDPHRKIELMYGGGPTAVGEIGNDYDAGARIARKYGASIHNTCYEGYDPAPLLGTYTREWGITHTCETAGTPCDIPNHQQGMFDVLKFGAKGYCWVGGRPYGYYPSFAKLGPAAREVSDAKPIGKKVGVLESLSAYQCDPRRDRLREVIAQSFQFVHDASLPADLYTDRSFMADGHRLNPVETPVILDCAAPVLTAQAADAMAAYVQAGGTLILHASSGKFTPGAPNERYKLLTSLGYLHAGELPDGLGQARAIGEGPMAGKPLTLTGISPLALLPDGARILAKFGDGQTAAASWRCGAGWIIVLGGTPRYTDAATRTWMTALLAEYGVVPISTATAGVITATLEGGATRYVLLHNPAPGAVRSTVATAGLDGTIRAFDLANRRALGSREGSDWRRGVEIKLGPYEVTAIALDRPSAPARTFAPLEYPLPAASDSPDGISVSVYGNSSALFASYRPVTNWLTVGEFDNPGGFNGSSFYLARPPEMSWNPDERFVEDGQTLTWRPASAFDGELRLSNYYALSSGRIAYAMTDLVADRACTVRLRCGVDYALFLWLNGQPLFDSNATSHGAPTPDDFTIEVPLRAGRNRLAARVAPGSLGWALWMQIASQQGSVVSAQTPS